MKTFKKIKEFLHHYILSQIVLCLLAVAVLASIFLTKGVYIAALIILVLLILVIIFETQIRNDIKENKSYYK